MKRKKTQRNANRNRRAVRVEPLQDRMLMAADYGMFIGPVEPNIDMPAAEVAKDSTVKSNDGIQGRTIFVNLFNGDLNIVGSNYHDDVRITNESGGILLITATTRADNGDEVGTAEIRYNADAVNKIVFDGHFGNDDFVNQTMKQVEARGGHGDDDLQTLGGGAMWGGEGNDRLRGNLAGISLWGEDGNDHLFGSRYVDYLNGGDDNDQIRGGRGSDSMYGGDGDDRIYGGSGHDKIYAGLGNDLLKGEDGNDTMLGDRGQNYMYGGDGNDTMVGGTGRDLMLGEDGNDIMMGQQGNDRLDGGEGNDKLSGGSGNDTLSGRGGHDELFGNNGYDYLFGGDERDLLDGGDDMLPDTVYGQEGDDIFVRHAAATFLGTDDPDKFRDFDASEADEVFKDYFQPNYGNDFPYAIF